MSVWYVCDGCEKKTAPMMRKAGGRARPILPYGWRRLQRRDAVPTHFCPECVAIKQKERGTHGL